MPWWAWVLMGWCVVSAAFGVFLGTVARVTREREHTDRTADAVERFLHDAA